MTIDPKPARRLTEIERQRILTLTRDFARKAAVARGQRDSAKRQGLPMKQVLEPAVKAEARLIKYLSLL